jgi:hypothetical protein
LIKNARPGWGMALVTACLPTKHEAVTSKKKKCSSEIVVMVAQLCEYVENVTT